MIMPIHRIRSFLTLAMVDPTDLDVIEDIRFRTGLSIQPVIASESSDHERHQQVLWRPPMPSAPKQTIDDIELADDSKISIIEEVKEETMTSRRPSSPQTKRPSSPSSIPFSSRPSRKVRATSISSRTRRPSVIRYRIDGILYETMNLPMKFKNPVTLARQDPVEHEHRRKTASAGRPHQDAGEA